MSQCSTSLISGSRANVDGPANRGITVPSIGAIGLFWSWSLSFIVFGGSEQTRSFRTVHGEIILRWGNFSLHHENPTFTTRKLELCALASGDPARWPWTRTAADKSPWLFVFLHRTRRRRIPPMRSTWFAARQVPCSCRAAEAHANAGGSLSSRTQTDWRCRRIHGATGPRNLVGGKQLPTASTGGQIGGAGTSRREGDFRLHRERQWITPGGPDHAPSRRYTAWTFATADDIANAPARG